MDPSRLIPRRAIGLSAVLILGLGFGLMSVRAGSAPPQAPERPQIPVVLAPVQAAPNAGAIRATAKIKAVREARLAFKVGGLIKAIRVDVGDRVRKGQTLAELDLKEVNSQTAQARANLDKAQRDLDRARKLVKSGAVPQTREDDAKTAVDVARANLDAVTFNRDLASIIADDDGVILTRSAEIGEIVAAGSPILTLGDTSAAFLARAGLADRDVVRVALGDRAQIILDSDRAQTLSGRITRVSAMADPRTGTFDVEATFDPQPQGSGVNLASGLVADMVISPKVATTDARKLSIPITAVLEAHGDEGFVFVYDAATSRVARRRITIGPIKGGQIVVTQGVAIGEQVVTKGAIYLRDGDGVTVSANAESKP